MFLHNNSQAQCVTAQKWSKQSSFLGEVSRYIQVARTKRSWHCSLKPNPCILGLSSTLSQHNSMGVWISFVALTINLGMFVVLVLLAISSSACRLSILLREWWWPLSPFAEYRPSSHPAPVYSRYIERTGSHHAASHSRIPRREKYIGAGRRLAASIARIHDWPNRWSEDTTGSFGWVEQGLCQLFPGVGERG